MAFFLGADRKIARRDAKAVAELEKSLAHAMTPTEMRRQSKRTYNPYPLREIADVIPGVSFMKVFVVKLHVNGSCSLEYFRGYS